MALSRKNKVLVSSFVFLISLAAAAAVVFHFLPPNPQPLPPDTAGFYRQPGSWPGLRHEQVPGMSGTLNGVSVKINNLGLRGADVPEEKPAGVTRVIIVGDSVVFGQGVPESGTLAVQLQAMLNKKQPGKNWQVLNAGVRGYNARDYRVWLKNRGLTLDPDVVVLVITEINDPEIKTFTPHSEKIGLWKNSRWTKLPVVDRIIAGAYADEVNRLFVTHVREIYGPAGEDWKFFMGELTAIRDLCKSNQVPLLAVSFPMIADDDMFAKERARLAAALSDLGISRLDPRPSFAAIPSSDLAVSPSDFHPNARALGIVAQMLAETIAKSH